MRIDGSSSPPPFHPAPHFRARKLEKDKSSYQQKKTVREKNTWKSCLTYLIEHCEILADLCQWLWEKSIDGQPISAKNMHLIKIPKFFPQELKQKCADLLALKIETALNDMQALSIAEISILPFPKLEYSLEAEERVRSAISQKIKETGQVEKYTLGWGRNLQAPDQDDPKISHIFIETFIKTTPKHTDLTIESLPQKKGDLTNLLKSLENTTTLRLSTTIEKEITPEFVEALTKMPKLQTIIFKKPDEYRTEQFKNSSIEIKESTWDKLDSFLIRPNLKIKRDHVFKPTKDRPWMEKPKPVQLELREKKDIEIDLKKKWADVAEW